MAKVIAAICFTAAVVVIDPHHPSIDALLQLMDLRMHIIICTPSALLWKSPMEIEAMGGNNKRSNASAEY